MTLSIGSRVRIARDAIGALDFNPGGIVVEIDYGGVTVEVGELVGDQVVPLHFRARVKESDLEALED
ncbi:MAG TPA: hypothetical protein VN903_24530 [Polyangia bacterium]|nr:hypothetical protein [Polyangia bacterium]